MSNSLSVFDNLQEIQDEYLELLTAISSNFSKDNMIYHIDEVKNFWLKRANKIEMIINWIIKDELNISYFTCATKLDMDDYDYYSFVLYGEYHIFDDPLVTHMTVSNISNKDFSELMFEKAKTLINDNIRVLKELKSIIWVIPIRLLYSSLDRIEQIVEKTDEYFLSLFDGIQTKKMYFDICKDIEDVDRLLKKEFKNTICLTNYETPKNTFLEKFDFLKNDKEIAMLKFEDDAHLFYFQMHSFILQALDVIFTSIASRMVPFIRFVPSFINFQLIIQNFIKGIVEAKIISAKSVVHHLLYKRFDYEEFTAESFEKFLEVSKKMNLNQKISNDDLILLGRTNFKYISDSVDQALEDLYSINK
ncbi:MAG: hypothetical protein WC479_01530 [Candidatus Izemoplasmatales bacterium]|jgi:hypothetical protein